MRIETNRRVPVVVGVLALAAVCVVALVATGTASASKTSKPLIDVEGSSYTNTPGITGQTSQQTQFSTAATEAKDGTVSGTFSEQLYNVAQDGTLTEIANNNVNVDCLTADKKTGTVWFSGLVTSGSDQRLPPEQQTQEQQIISNGQLILIGRFRDTNGDGIVDERSLFVAHATQPYANALVLSSDIGTLSSPWFINGNATSPATACLQQDNDYISADYRVVHYHGIGVQWLEPDDATTVGNPVQGTALDMANPPPASIYNVSSVTRTLLSPTLFLTIK